ncbi:hypothetical protein NDU88_004542 [Pleurodeles waltl]|uniref:Uncharacterized protein n=1 Tax=Pleurodeles waltl TaxID=8319 RepID=A0AAV7T827_PLEWA|nr:hypothetical protein NDU88_004542 [Pleurodeles waltl]
MENNGGGEKSGDVEPSLFATMEAIRDLKSSLELKLDAVTVDLNLLGADIYKTSEKVKSAKSHIHLLQSTVKSLTKEQAHMSARLEDQDLFLDDLIVNHFHPKRLPNIFLHCTGT